MEQKGTIELMKRVGESVTMTCPVLLEVLAPEADISWEKDGRPLDPLGVPNIRVCFAKIAFFKCLRVCFREHTDSFGS